MNHSQSPSPNFTFLSDENSICPFMDNYDFTNLMFDVGEGGNNGLIQEEPSSPTTIVTGESGGSGSAFTTLSKKEPT